MQMILAGLMSLDSVSGSRYYGQLMEKIQAGSSELISGIYADLQWLNLLLKILSISVIYQIVLKSIQLQQVVRKSGGTEEIQSIHLLRNSYEDTIFRLPITEQLR